jgi:HAD superfamily hydrolase (TIGR01509 family)
MKALIFDMDGLMIDSERLYFQAQRDIADKYEKPLKEETLWKMMGRKPIESITLFVNELDIPASPEEILELRNGIMKEKLENDLEAMPGLDHIVEFFHGRLKLAIATGAQKEFLDIAVDRLGIRKRFDVLQPSDDIRNGKPDPEIYLKACERLDMEPQQCVVLEDSSNGALSGKRAGCYVIAVPTEYTREQDFSFADFIARDLFHAQEHVTEIMN